MQSILGAGGSIGNYLAQALTDYTDQIRLMSRNPKKVNPADELSPGDLTRMSDVRKAVSGAEVAYLVVGLPYDIRIWREKWPVIMYNTIEACSAENCKLVFFDNVYMYDINEIPHMTESFKINPPSKKGAVRAQVLDSLTEAIDKGHVEALVARAADFYGPDRHNSMLVETVYKPLAEGKTANWLGKADCRHSFTYTPDAAKATALLGNRAEAYGQQWHLPTVSNPPTGKEWVEAIAKELNVEPKFREVSKAMITVMGLFNRTMREIKEMYYQNDRDYVFDSSKFEKAFGMAPTPYEEGIRAMVVGG